MIVVCCPLPVDCYCSLLFAACWLLLDVCMLLRVARRVWIAVCCSGSFLFVACCLLFAIRCALFVVRCLTYVVCQFNVVYYCLLFVACC